MSKVACIECGVQILPATSLSTGGLCMPCKTGRRQSIDQARQRRQKRRDDPLDNFWRELVRQVYETASGFSGLSEVEKQYFAVGVLIGDVYNGGFEQYFFNSSADYFHQSLTGLEDLGAAQSCILVRRAKQVLFGFRDVPSATSQRRTFLLETQSKSRDERLQALDEQFWKDPDGLTGRYLAFARKHGRPC